MNATDKTKFVYEDGHALLHWSLGLVSLLMGMFGAYYTAHFLLQLLAGNEEITLYYKFIHFVLMLAFTPIIVVLELRAKRHRIFLSESKRKILIGAAVTCLVLPGLTAEFFYNSILKQNGYEFCGVIAKDRIFSVGNRKSYHSNLYKRMGKCDEG